VFIGLSSMHRATGVFAVSISKHQTHQSNVERFFGSNNWNGTTAVERDARRGTAINGNRSLNNDAGFQLDFTSRQGGIKTDDIAIES
jgi:hypothetical protein